MGVNTTTCSGIEFYQYRTVNTKTTTGEFSINIEGIRTLPTILIHELAIDRRALKVYSPYDTKASLYIPTGMESSVMIVGSVEGNEYIIDIINDIFANDLLMVKAFGYPSYQRVFGVNTQWWVKSIKLDTKSGYRQEGTIRHEIQLDLSKKGVS